MGAGLCLALLLCIPVSVHAQDRRYHDLLRRNDELQRKVDSLSSRLAALELTADPWTSLEGLDDGWNGEGISTLDDGDDFPVYVLRASPSFDIEYDPSVGVHVQRYLGTRRRMTEKALGRYARWYPMFSGTFARYGVPDELTALCIVESAVTSGAVSPAGAAGMWQLMPMTARQYGLVLDENVDERLDVTKSTDAAARLLRDLHDRLGSWSLALMAYNCGAENVRKAQIRAGGGTDPWMILRYLPGETQAYLPAFLAVSYLSVYGEVREGLKAE